MALRSKIPVFIITWIIYSWASFSSIGFGEAYQYRADWRTFKNEWELEGYKLNPDGWIETAYKGAGKAKLYFFPGPAGYYTVRFRYFNKPEAESTIKFYVGSSFFKSWRMVGNKKDNNAWFTIEHVFILTGETLTIRGISEGHEFARIVQFEAVLEQ